MIPLSGSIKNYSVGNNRVIMLFQKSDKEFWIGTESGLFSFDVETEFISEIPLNLNHSTKPIVWDVVETKDGEVWLATMHHGVFIWKGSDSQQLWDRSSFAPLISNNSISTIYAMEIDDQGFIWCSTDSGLARIDPHTKEFRFFSQQHGLQLSEFDFGVSHHDQAGNLYFGGSNGYTRFDPKLINPTQKIPKLIVTKLILPDDTVDSISYLSSIKQIQLTHKDYFIQFDFSVLDFLDPEKNQYRYMLEGFDRDWIENGTRNTATYTSLPPGDYTLRIQGANSAGIWNREGISVDLEVLPPPWQTWWAYALYCLALLSFLGFCKRVYDSSAIERRARQKANEMIATVERADDEIQEQLEIHDDLVKSVYRHSVSTLNLVSEFIAIKGAHLVDEDAREVTLASVNRVEALAALEECLYYQNEILLADMNKYTNVILGKLLKISPIGEEKITSINQVSAQPLPIELASPLSIALYELLENAIQHAFESASEPHYLQVSFVAEQSQQQGRGYCLKVQDNGIGIPPNIEPMSSQTPGLAIITAMSQRLSGELEFQINNGTLATLRFPEK